MGQKCCFYNRFRVTTKNKKEKIREKLWFGYFWGETKSITRTQAKRLATVRQSNLKLSFVTALKVANIEVLKLKVIHILLDFWSETKSITRARLTPNRYGPHFFESISKCFWLGPTKFYNFVGALVSLPPGSRKTIWFCGWIAPLPPPRKFLWNFRRNEDPQGVYFL